MSTISVRTIKDKWHDLSPRARSGIAIVGFLAALMIVTSWFVKPGHRPRKHEEADAVSNLALPKPRDATNEQLLAQNQATNAQVENLKQKLTQEDQDKQLLLKKVDDLTNNANHQQPGVNADLAKEVMQMKSQLDALSQKNSGAGGTPSLSDSLPPLPSAAGKQGAQGQAAPDLAADAANDSSSLGDDSTIRVTGDDSASAATVAKAADPIPYLPPGSMFEAVLLNGMDAPTSQVGEKNPVPSVLRVKTDAILPNAYSYNVKECFVLVSGYGSLSSERAQLRTETISCVRDGGRSLESRLDGYVVGEDGRTGMRGRLVSKQGQLIAKSLAAGVLSGFSNALTPQQIPQLELGSGNGYISTQRATLGSIGETGVATGFSSAAKSVSAFYLDMAKEMTPVVEIDAGRKVTIVLIKGVQLK